MTARKHSNNIKREDENGNLNAEVSGKAATSSKTQEILNTKTHDKTRLLQFVPLSHLGAFKGMWFNSFINSLTNIDNMAPNYRTFKVKLLQEIYFKLINTCAFFFYFAMASSDIQNHCSVLCFNAFYKFFMNVKLKENPLNIIQEEWTQIQC